MQTLAKDDSPDMSAPRAALMKRLEEVATKDWLAVLRKSTAKQPRSTFAIPLHSRHNHAMSVVQVTQEIAQMSEDEQFHVAAFLQHLVDERDPNHAAAMAAANQRMDGGQKVAFEEVLERHEALESQGR